MKPCDLKKLRPNKYRLFVEHGLTVAIWSIWIWSAVLTIKNWRFLTSVFSTSLPALEQEFFACGVLFALLWIRYKLALGSNRHKASNHQYDSSAKEKCLNLFGWSAEDLSLAQNARVFDVRTAADSLECTITVRESPRHREEAESIAAKHG